MPPPPSPRQTRPSGEVDGTSPPPPLPLIKLVTNFLVGIVWAAIYLARWFETRFLHPAADFFLDVALTSAEEGAKSLLREGFAALSRGVDGATAAILALLVDRRYWRARRSLAGSRRRAAWADYWREGRPSTLNAVVARTGATKGAEGGAAGDGGALSPSSSSPFARVAATAAAAAADGRDGTRGAPRPSPEARGPSSSLSPLLSASASPSQQRPPLDATTRPPRLSSSSRAFSPPAPPLRGPRPRGWAGKAASRAAHAAAGALVAARSAVAGDGGASAVATAEAAAAAAARGGSPGLCSGMIPIDADAASVRRAAADAAAATAVANASRAAAVAAAAAAETAAAAGTNAEDPSQMFSRAPSGSSLRRNGSDLFDRANWSTDVARSRGLLEDTRLALEEALSAAADALRAGVRWLLLMPGPPQPIDFAGSSGGLSGLGFGAGAGATGAGTGAGGAGGANHHALHFHNVAFPPPSQPAAPRPSAPAAAAAAPAAAAPSSASLLATHPGTTPGGATRWEELARDRPRGARVLRRSSSASQAAELLSEVRTAGDVVVAAGYPLEEHTVTTSDGYVLTMQRIPRRGARDVALFVHGIMDTSMGWVGNGVTGSHAFAAFDAGSDVWLANSRANPPCAHVDCPRMDPRGLRYWRYTVNEMAMEDVAAQVDHVHVVKTQELRPAAWWSGAGAGGGAGASGDSAGGPSGGEGEPRQRAASEQPASASPPPSRPPASVLERGFARVAAADAAATLASAAGRVRPSASDSDLVSFSSGLAGGRGGDAASEEGAGAAAAAAAAAVASHLTPHLASVAVLAAAAAADSGAATAPPNEATLRAAIVAGGAEGVLPARSILRHQASEAAALLASSSSSSSSAAGTGWRRNAPGSAPPARGGGGARHGGTPPPAAAAAANTAAMPPSPLPRARPLAASAASTPSRPGASCYAPSVAATAAAAAAAAATATARAAAAASEDALRRRRCRGEAEGAAAAADRAGVGVGGEGAFLSAAAAAQVAAAAAEEDRLSPATSPSSSSSSSSSEPYRLTAVGHSMGGAALLMYAVMCRVVRRPHHLSRLVLLSPAGFQSKPPLLSRPFIRMVPLWTAFLDKVVGRFFVPGAGLRFLLPTSPLRFVAFKLTHDLRHLPAAEELARAFARACMSGDTSEWDRALRLPHYSARDMPSVRLSILSFVFLPLRNPTFSSSLFLHFFPSKSSKTSKQVSVHMGNHLCQWIRSDKFQLYDYGSDPKTGNAARYGTDAPPDVAALYRLLDVPVDIVAGRADGVVAAADVARHHRAMVAAGVKDVSYVEFPDAGHMDLVMSSKDDVRRYVMKLLRGRRGGGGNNAAE